MDYNELMPMDIEDLRNWEMLFDMTIRGLDEHLQHDKLDEHFVMSTLISLDRSLQVIIKDMDIQWRDMAGKIARRELAAREMAV